MLYLGCHLSASAGNAAMVKTITMGLVKTVFSQSRTTLIFCFLLSNCKIHMYFTSSSWKMQGIDTDRKEKRYKYTMEKPDNQLKNAADLL